ncbi:FBD-associated F-box protein [Striga asiatica]|uniref:FBD-associated F-box protein n=1 Tax=Striga asiatica TaxID=4170 RepID=A0A5A7RAL2_STRAF|nr:FBD-associated F-box protein [Striga asiatica]
MLNALPDEILSQILSFLPFKTSVSTSTLAVRWRRLWTYAPNIQLTGDSIPCSISERTKFVRTLTIILSQCETHGVNTLRLPMGYFNKHELESCLESAFACNVKFLHLTLPYALNIIPPCVFTSKTLVELRIKNLHIEMKNGVVCLPALKRLCLDYVDFRLGCSLESMISGCPVLEDFTLGYCLLGDSEIEGCHCISSPIMKRLVLHCGLTPTSRLKIDTPALEYVVLRFNKPYNISIGSMASLIEADIFVFCLNFGARSLVELLGRFSNVKDMKLSILGKVRDITPADLNINFHNLAKLTVGGDCRFISYFVEKANKLEVLNVKQCLEPQCEMELLHHWWFLTYLLEKADKLKVLIIRTVYNKHNRKRWLAVHLQVPNCLLSHLKIVQIRELYCMENELDMVRYLLKNAKVLERMELHCFERMEQHCLEESIGRISSFDRGSEKCEIVFN